MNILLAGGTGFIGGRLTEILIRAGHMVRLLSRHPDGPGQFAWDPIAGKIDEAALEGVEAVINLAGEGIADKRWTEARKKKVVESRTQSAAVLRDAFQRTGHLPKVYVSASAIGYYGNTGEKWLVETDPPGEGFLSECCVVWEQAADTVAALGIRTVKFRFGIVLEQDGGALAEILRPMRFGIAAYFADGRAWYSWIHRDDVCRMLLWAIENEVEGVFNAVAPAPVRNKELIKQVVRARRKPAPVMPAPAFALRIMLGEMADAVLFSNRVSSEKAVAAGFVFQFPELEGALADIFKKSA